VRLQRIDTGDRLAEVVLVPPAPEDEDSEGEEAEGADSGSTEPAATDA
jgi:hypothetical protein